MSDWDDIGKTITDERETEPIARGGGSKVTRSDHVTQGPNAPSVSVAS